MWVVIHTYPTLDDSPPSKRRKTKATAEMSKNTPVHAAEDFPFDADRARLDDMNVDMGGMDMNFEMGGRSPSSSNTNYL